MEIRWTRSSRKHRIGRAHALYVINTTGPQVIATVNGDDALLWVGTDERGVDLEIIAVVVALGVHVVIHVMPASFRR